MHAPAPPFETIDREKQFTMAEDVRNQVGRRDHDHDVKRVRHGNLENRSRGIFQFKAPQSTSSTRQYQKHIWEMSMLMQAAGKLHRSFQNS